MRGSGEMDPPNQGYRDRSARARVAMSDARPSPIAVVATFVAAVCLILTAATFGRTVSAQDGRGPGGSVEIRAGTCSTLGDVTALLETLALPTTASGEQALATSVTDVMQPFAELAARPGVILAGQACGSLPGQPVGELGSAVVLAEDDGEVAGIALLSELGTEATRVHLFVFERRSAVEADGAGSASPGASPSPSASPDPAAVPGEEIDPSEDIDVDVDG